MAGGGERDRERRPGVSDGTGPHAGAHRTAGGAEVGAAGLRKQLAGVLVHLLADRPPRAPVDPTFGRLFRRAKIKTLRNFVAVYGKRRHRHAGSCTLQLPARGGRPKSPRDSALLLEQPARTVTEGEG